MTDLSSLQASWLSKYVRDSWHYQDGKVNVKGNVTITDHEMKELPFMFGDVEGVFKLKGCASLISVKGMPPNYFDIEFENCAFKASYYIEAMRMGISLEEFFDKNIVDMSIFDKEAFLTIKKLFPSLYESSRGQIAGAKYGF